MAELEQTGYILVVDDDADICEVIGLALTDEGYEDVCVNSFDEALRQVQQQRPRLVLFDLVMPGRSGEDLVKTCRALPGPHMPMVAVSAASNVEDAATAIDADGYLTKPFEITELLALVEQASSLPPSLA